MTRSRMLSSKFGSPLRLLPGENPDELISRARVEHRPVAAFCLFSGGGDSAVLAHRCRDQYGALAYIDTGTAVPGVREYVEDFAEWLGKPLQVHHPEPDGEPPGSAWRRLVLDNGGFPGPAGHGRAYTRLKERAIESLVRDAKGEFSRGLDPAPVPKAHAGQVRRARVMLLTGKRRAESARRSKTTKGIDRRGAQLYVNPLIDWTDDEMRAYRLEHLLPEAPVAALLHRSGECNCGSFATPGEREMLRSLWPAWFDETIASLEQQASDQGIAACRWGERPPGAVVGDVGPMCSSCEFRLFDLEEAA